MSQNSDSDSAFDSNSDSESGAEDFSFLSGLLLTDAYSDMQLQHPEKTFQLHQAIVCTQSPVIAAALSSGFQEGTTGILKVDGSFGLDTVQRMVDFLYTQNYSVEPAVEIEEDRPSTPKRPKSSQSPVTNHTKKHLPVILNHLSVLEIADYYRLECLETLATANIKELLRENWSAELFVTIARRGLEKISEGPFVTMVANMAFKHLKQLIEFDEFAELAKNPTLMLLTLAASVRQIHRIDRAKKMVRKFNKCIEETINCYYNCEDCGERANYYCIEKTGSGFDTDYTIVCGDCNPDIIVRRISNT